MMSNNNESKKFPNWLGWRDPRVSAHPPMVVQYGLADRMAKDGRIVKVTRHNVGYWKCARCKVTLRTAAQVAVHVRRMHEYFD